MEKVDCSICGHKSDLVFHKNGHDFYRCGDCLILFVYPIPVNTEIIYGENYFTAALKNQGFGYTNYDLDKEPMRFNFVNYLKLAEAIVSGRKVLDVGAATGFFLDIAKKRGWDTYGVEISEYATLESQKRGHKVEKVNFPDLPSSDKYNLVTMWDVLEHVNNPNSYIAKASNILDSDGVLLINTIDSRSLWARLLGRRWHLIVPPEHLFYFSKKSLIKLLENNGFTIESISKPSKKFTLSYIFKMLYKWQSFILWKKISNLLENTFIGQKIFFPINLYDNIFIVAKKD